MTNTGTSEGARGLHYANFRTVHIFARSRFNVQDFEMSGFRLSHTEFQSHNLRRVLQTTGNQAASSDALQIERTIEQKLRITRDGLTYSATLAYTQFREQALSTRSQNRVERFA